MATITNSSVLVTGVVQVDGTVTLRETYVTSAGETFTQDYTAPNGDDHAGHLTAAAAKLLSDLTANEVTSNVSQVVLFGSQAAPTLKYSTAVQNFAALRQYYQTATRIEAVMIGDFLNTLTSNQLQTAFSLTAGQVTTLRNNKLQPAADLATSIRAATGQ